MHLNHLIWTALLLGYGVLCGCTGAAIRARTRHPDAGFLPDVATMAAMNTLRANHPAEFTRLLGAETARQDGGDHA